MKHFKNKALNVLRGAMPVAVATVFGAAAAALVIPAAAIGMTFGLLGVCLAVVGVGGSMTVTALKVIKYGGRAMDSNINKQMPVLKWAGAVTAAAGILYCAGGLSQSFNRAFAANQQDKEKPQTTLVVKAPQALIHKI